MSSSRCHDTPSALTWPTSTYKKNQKETKKIAAYGMEEWRRLQTGCVAFWDTWRKAKGKQQERAPYMPKAIGVLQFESEQGQGVFAETSLPLAKCWYQPTTALLPWADINLGSTCMSCKPCRGLSRPSNYFTTYQEIPRAQLKHWISNKFLRTVRPWCATVYLIFGQIRYLEFTFSPDVRRCKEIHAKKICAMWQPVLGFLLNGESSCECWKNLIFRWYIVVTCSNTW